MIKLENSLQEYVQHKYFFHWSSIGTKLNINISSHVERIEGTNPTKVMHNHWDDHKNTGYKEYIFTPAATIKSGVHRMKEIPLCGQQVALLANFLLVP